MEDNFFPENLKILRKNSGLSQSKLGDKIGVDQTTIGRWEDGNREPTMGNLVNLSKVFNVKLETLITDDLTKKQFNLYKMNVDNNTEIDILTDPRIKDLPKETQADILKQALEQKQKMILDETEQILNIKKELDNIGNKQE